MNQIEELVSLRSRVEELEVENEWLRFQLQPRDGRFRTIGLTPGERRILIRLYDASPRAVSRESLIASLGNGERDSANNVLSVFVSKIRRKLIPFSAKVISVSCEGYLLPPASREILSTILVKEDAQ